MDGFAKSRSRSLYSVISINLNNASTQQMKITLILMMMMVLIRKMMMMMMMMVVVMMTVMMMTMTSSDDDDNDDDDDDEWHYNSIIMGWLSPFLWEETYERDIMRHYAPIQQIDDDDNNGDDDDDGGGGGCDDDNNDNNVNNNEWWFWWWWWWWVLLLIKSLWDGIHLFYDMRHVSEEPCQQCPVAWRQLSKELFSFFHLFTSVLDTYSKTIMRRTATSAIYAKGFHLKNL